MIRAAVIGAALLMFACGSILGVQALDVDELARDGGPFEASIPDVVTAPDRESPPIPDEVPDAMCITTDAQTPAVVAQTAPNGEGQAWSSPTRVETQDDSPATVPLSGGFIDNNTLLVSQLLEATDFGFQVPSSATITGVTFGLRVHGVEGGFAQDRTVELLGVPAGGANLARSAFYGSQSAYEDRTYGGDLWGLPLTPAIVNDPSFGVGLSVQRGSITALEGVSVDVMTLAITYCVQ